MRVLFHLKSLKIFYNNNHSLILSNIDALTTKLNDSLTNTIKNKMTIIPQAYYKISGLVIATNSKFLFINDFFDSAALYDIGISWGQIADKKLFKKYNKLI